MRIIVANDYDQLSSRASDIIASQLILKPNSVLGLATGSTPIGTYAKLIGMFQDGKIDFADVIAFNLDEYYGLAAQDHRSYAFFMATHFFNHINIPRERTYIPNGLAPDIEEECYQYEAKIRQAGGIDLQLLGIGHNGHIGFNEPDVKFEALTHLVHLDEDTIHANARFFASLDEVPRLAISMGIKTIMHARKILLLASGKEKAATIAGMVHGKITPELPASVLQLHPDVTVVVDKEAGAALGSIR